MLQTLSATSQVSSLLKLTLSTATEANEAFHTKALLNITLVYPITGSCAYIS